MKGMGGLCTNFLDTRQGPGFPKAQRDHTRAYEHVNTRVRRYRAEMRPSTQSHPPWLVRAEGTGFFYKWSVTSGISTMSLETYHWLRDANMDTSAITGTGIASN